VIGPAGADVVVEADDAAPLEPADLPQAASETSATPIRAATINLRILVFLRVWRQPSCGE
jgi:hypothetical protein